jgi:hypothetical protein
MALASHWVPPHSSLSFSTHPPGNLASAGEALPSKQLQPTLQGSPKPSTTHSGQSHIPSIPRVEP